MGKKSRTSMNINKILKQIEFPFSAYYFGHSHHTLQIKEWKDIYDIFDIQQKNTIMDVSFYHSTKEIPVMLIGTAHDVFVYKQQDDRDYPMKVKQSITIYKPLKYYKRVSFYHIERWENIK